MPVCFFLFLFFSLPPPASVCLATVPLALSGCRKSHSPFPGTYFEPQLQLNLCGGHLVENGTFPRVFMARIEHYCIISCNTLYHARIGGALTIHVSSPDVPLASTARSTSTFRATVLLKVQNAAVTLAPSFHPSQFHKYRSG